MDSLHQTKEDNKLENCLSSSRHNSPRNITSSERSSPGWQHYRNPQVYENSHRPLLEKKHRSSFSTMTLSRTSDTPRPSHPPAVVAAPLPGLAPSNEPVYKFAATCRPSTSREQIRYSLIIYQQPRHARMVGNGEKADRRPVDPPPVLKFEVSDYSQANPNSMDLTLLRSPYFICYSTLCEAEGPYEELYGIPHSGKPYMVGSIVSSMFQLREGRHDLPDGHYFVFADLGVRVEGRYRLKFSVYEIVDCKVYHCASTMSEPFEVFTAKRFPGMHQSTDISKLFAQQGMRLRVRTKNSVESPLCPPKRTSSGSSEKSNPQAKAPKKPRKTQPPVQVQLPSCTYPIPTARPISLPLPAAICPRNGTRKNGPSLPSPALMLEGAKPNSSSSHQSILDELKKQGPIPTYYRA